MYNREANIGNSDGDLAIGWKHNPMRYLWPMANLGGAEEAALSCASLRQPAGVAVLLLWN